MSELTTSASEPSYITKLALSSAPFNDLIEPALFYAGGQAGHRLNLLLHLVRASDKIANLVAEQGYGKSALLMQLQQRTGDEIRLCFVNAELHTDMSAILGQCLIGLGVNSHDIESAEDPLQVFKTRLEQLRQLGITPVMLIDNADLLAVSLRSEIATWITWEGEKGFLLQAVIASRQPFILPGAAQNRLQVVTLPALSENELSSYLMHRLNGVGFRADSPFFDKDLKRIYQQSMGSPDMVNQLAHQQLLGIKQTKPTWAMLDNWLAKMTMRWAGLGVVIVAFLLLLLFQDTVNGWLIAAEPDNSALDETTMVIEEEADLPLVVTEEQAERDELADLIAEIPDINELEVEAAESKSTQNLVEKTQRPVAVVTPVDSAPVIPDFLKKEWVMAQAANHYTFQLMGSWEREEAYDFIEQYALVGDVAIFESMRNGQVWHVLVYGSFQSKQAALKASTGWPAPLNTLPSWLRRFDSVQQQIKNKAVISQ
jgi:DamX protein